MGNPPRDSEGRVKPHDDPDIPNDAYVLRYIPTGWLRPDKRGGRKLSSAVFGGSSRSRDPYQSMSVDLLKPMLDDGLPPVGRKLADHEAVVRLKVGDLRDLGFKVGPDPGNKNDPYHVGVWGVKSRHREKIRDMAEWVDKPADVS